MPNSWISALKQWNAETGMWCLPKKGTKEHEQVMTIMQRMKADPSYKAESRLKKEEPKVTRKLRVEVKKEEPKVTRKLRVEVKKEEPKPKTNPKEAKPKKVMESKPKKGKKAKKIKLLSKEELAERDVKYAKKLKKELEDEAKRKPITVYVSPGDILYDSNHDQKWQVVKDFGNGIIVKKPKGKTEAYLEWSAAGEKWEEVAEDKEEEKTDRFQEKQVICDMMY
jgi:hypothetical protein